MSKVLQVAWREFIVTVTSKAFILGLLAVPVMSIVMVWAAPKVFGPGDLKAQGAVAVIDPDGRVNDALRTALDPDSVRRRREQVAARALEQLPPEARALVGGQAIAQAGPGIELVLDERPADADIEAEKARLHAAPPAERPLALVVLHENVVEPRDGSPALGGYDLYVPPRLDDRIQGEIRRALTDAIVMARITARGYDPETIRALVSVPRVRAIAVSPEREQGASVVFTMLLPMAFVLLLFLGVMTGGQALLTSTVEEKSSRVIEVLLSAVSPMQLMTGKLVGHMAVSFVVLALYIGMGLALLAGVALLGFLDFSLILYLVIFFVITYLVLGSLMMAIGSAVNEIREAQSMMMPIVLLLVVPWLLWMPISRAPDSALSVTLSFLPPINSFAMLLRMASVSPPPAWQVWLSIAIGAASVVAALWFTAKVFRIGLLMHGKPPNLMTLLRWARAA